MIFIYEIRVSGDFSPIHLLNLWTIFSFGLAIYFVHVGNIKRYEQAIIALYNVAVVLAGFFTFMPLHR